MITEDEIFDIWGIKLKKMDKKIDLFSSPEREFDRESFINEREDIYIVESILEEHLYHRKKLIDLYKYFDDKNFNYTKNYIKTLNGEFYYLDEKVYLLRNYIKANSLNQEKYLKDVWRGEALAKFLIELKKVSKEISFIEKEEDINVKEHVYYLFEKLKKYRPTLAKQFEKIKFLLEIDFFEKYDSLENGFCHGDLHPINVLWGQNKIVGVIDWEFFAYKKEIYDLANLIGCMGFENPSSLIDEITIELLNNIYKSKIYDELSIQYLMEFIIAQRSSWLSLWLKKEDRDMIKEELIYMEFLVDNITNIQNIWKKRVFNK